MKLNASQKKQITKWIKENKSIGEIQVALREKYELQLTYKEVRFLIDDLDLTFEDHSAASEISTDADDIFDGEIEIEFEEEPVKKPTKAKKTAKKAVTEKESTKPATLTAKKRTARQVPKQASGYSPIPFPGLKKIDIDKERNQKKVTLSIDDLQRPGTILSGTVYFSDGEAASWQIDDYGRLGLIPPHIGYQPSQNDINRFQQLIQAELKELGY